MKPLPEKIPMGAEMFADGANGYRMQQFFNPEFRVRCLSIKENRNMGWVRTWSIESLPDKAFKTYEELRSCAGGQSATKGYPLPVNMKARLTGPKRSDRRTTTSVSVKVKLKRKKK